MVQARLWILITIFLFIQNISLGFAEVTLQAAPAGNDQQLLSAIFGAWEKMPMLFQDVSRYQVAVLKILSNQKPVVQDLKKNAGPLKRPDYLVIKALSTEASFDASLAKKYFLELFAAKQIEDIQPPGPPEKITNAVR